MKDYVTVELNMYTEKSKWQFSWLFWCNVTEKCTCPKFFWCFYLSPFYLFPNLSATFIGLTFNSYFCRWETKIWLWPVRVWCRGVWWCRWRWKWQRRWWWRQPSRVSPIHNPLSDSQPPASPLSTRLAGCHKCWWRYQTARLLCWGSHRLNGWSTKSTADKDDCP